MLTDAQYRTLKAWPDGGALRLLTTGNGFSWMTRESGFLVKICTQASMNVLVRKGLARCSEWSHIREKVNPACDDAIREYEEAHKDDIKGGQE